ncbi:MAG TPA: hypothetical protein VK348_14135 [Planctomycetota bacterium]|nr:hypothetical protein [Planctomycetota bacterium]
MRTLIASTLLATLATAQQALFQPFGTGCTFNNLTLAIGNQGLPHIGQSFQVMYTGPNFTFSSGQQIAWPNLVLGLGQLSTVIPAGFLPQQPAGCQGYITGDVVMPTMPDPNGRPQYENFVTINVPNNPGLLGMNFNAQWLTIVQQCGFAGCNFSAVLTSDAALVQIGV